MVSVFLFYVHYALLLLFGILVSAAFSGIYMTRRNLFVLSSVFVCSGLLQLFVFFTFGEDFVWKIYPFITHLPLILTLLLYFRKRLITVLSAVSSAYLCCQPAKWIGIIVFALTGSSELELILRIAVLLSIGSISVFYLSAYFSEIYNKDTRSVLIFGSIPLIYYLYDYSMSIYTDFWVQNNRIAIEFLPFFLCIIYIVFCLVYYKTYEQKTDAERKEELIRITVDAMTKEIEAAKSMEQEIKIFRHDMRFILNRIYSCIDQNNTQEAKEIISRYISNAEATAIHRYCSSSAVNYILSSFSEKCNARNIQNSITVQVGSTFPDEIFFTSILSNALDNALNAQDGLKDNQKRIHLVLTASKGRLLLSVRNTFAQPPLFSEGYPVTSRKGHGFGVQSIRYMTERLGGSCQFSVEGDYFILRVVLPYLQY